MSVRLPGGQRALRPIFVGCVRDGSCRQLADDCGGRPRVWVDERRLIILVLGDLRGDIWWMQIGPDPASPVA